MAPSDTDRRRASGASLPAFHGLGALLTGLAGVMAVLHPLNENVVIWLWLILPAGFPLLILASRARGWDVARGAAEEASREDEEAPRVTPPLDDMGRRVRPVRAMPWDFVISILFWTLLMRLPLLATPPTLSDDVHRYVWEGRITALGENPYEKAPTDPSLAHLIPKAPEWASINHPELPAIYPPATQWVFAGVAFAAPDQQAFRAVMVGFDLLLVVALCFLLQARGLPIRRVVLYAWHPLVVVEVAGSGHYEPLALLPLVLALVAWTLRAPLVAFALWGVAFATKYIGAVAALFAARDDLVHRRLPRAVGLVTLLAVAAAVPALPFVLDGAAPIGSLGTYARDWAHNGSLHPLLATYIGFHPARLVVAALLLLWAGKLLTQPIEPARGFMLLFVGLILLSPVVHPWYGLWLIAFLPLFPRVSVMLFTVLLPLSYLVWAAEGSGKGWELPGWVPWLEYGLPLLWWRLFER